MQFTYDTAILAGINITSTSTSILNGTYAINTASQSNISAITTYIDTNKTFPDKITTLPWPDISGNMHLFPTTDLFLAFASAVGDYVIALKLGLSPSANVTII